MIKRTGKLSVVMVMILLYLTSCSKKDDYYSNYEQVINNYNGTALQYLESQAGVYDSMMVVINRVPGLRDTLASGNVTVFGIPNQSFTSVVNELNTLRMAEQKSPLYLRDLKIGKLDSMICQYIFKGAYLTSDIAVQTNGINLNSIKNNYQMRMEYSVGDASGFINAGVQKIIFTDLNNTLDKQSWVSTYTQSVNLKTTDNSVIHMLVAGHNFGFNKYILEFKQ